MAVNYFQLMANEIGISLWLIIIIALWSLVWKFLALWKSARKGSVVWFIVFALINTMGLLEIFYIFVFSKMKTKPIKARARKARRKKR